MAIAIPHVYGASGAIGSAMPAETKTKPKQETWRDWLPDGTPDPDEGDLLTLTEVLSHAAHLGAPVTDSEFRYWTSLGILPRPVRRRFKGATRATYPNWVVLIVYAAHELHRDGLPLATIRDRLRLAFRDGPDHFMENFVVMAILGPVGAAARHLRVVTGVNFDHANVTFSRDGDAEMAVTITTDLIL